MPWTFVLQSASGTDTVDLNDGTNTFVNVGGLNAPPPASRRNMAGANLFRHGEDMLSKRYGTRDVTVNFQIKGNNATDLVTRIQNIWNLVRLGQEYRTEGLGTVLQLKYQWTGAANPVYFNIIDAELDVGAGIHSPYLLKDTRIRNAQLRLICEPFAIGTTETLMNYAKDPSFEIAGSALADWTQDNNIGGSWSRSTATAKYGTAAVVSTATSGTTLSINQIYQNFVTIFTASDPVSISAWYLGTGLNASNVAELSLTVFNAGGTVISTATATGSATGTFTQISIANQTIDATGGTGTVSIRLRLRRNAGTSTSTITWDGAGLWKAAAVPTAWVSGRDVANHFDDNGQAHINYLDIYAVPGDVPALLQLKAAEVEAHTSFWVGGRHGDRTTAGGLWHEGESFTGSGGAIWGVELVSDASNGSVGSGSGAWTNPASPMVVTKSIATPPTGMYRVLIRARAGAGTAYFGMGYTYGSVTLTPNATAGYGTIASTVFTIVDIGALTIPPVEIPRGGTLGTFILRLAGYNSTSTTLPRVDWIMLMPVDQGFGYASKTSALDTVMPDSRSPLRAIYLLNSSDAVQAIPTDQQGDPPEVHPKGSRLYFHAVGGNTASIGAGWTMAVIYEPRYLMVR